MDASPSFGWVEPFARLNEGYRRDRAGDHPSSFEDLMAAERNSAAAAGSGVWF
jgi:hypothetical protein